MAWRSAFNEGRGFIPGNAIEDDPGYRTVKGVQ